MKRFFMIFFLIPLFVFGEEYPKTILLLNHPTQSNLKNITSLVEDSLIVIPNLHIVGIYNTNHAYRYDISRQYLHENNIDYVTLEGYDFNVSLDSLFKPNALSQKFYQLFRRSKGIIFPGGADIPPYLYREETHLLTDIMEYERLYELSFLFHLVGGYHDESFTPFLQENPEYVVLGICLGMQAMNVAAGGTLIQDIPTEIYHHKTYESLLQAKEERHKNYWNKIEYEARFPSFTIHGITLLPNSFLASFMNEKDTPPLHVVSIHHQSVKQLGKGYKIAARSTDGKIIEAIEHTIYPHVLGVQFHPEIWTIYDETYTFISHPEDAPISFKEVFSPVDISFHHTFWHIFSTQF
ncbi:MAG: gamma-glutamyl-gamma-aminobutyrate hydrolase family protein [Candidatus Marinimicrobia bacterium]|nr:gamma-glutamyl-gamma-aminobutyrate hydrolase family protein [Candidatus Neomarinimicrobiota bacterium]